MSRSPRTRSFSAQWLPSSRWLLPSSRGFTLLEVMTVVVIIAVFSAAALPSFVERIRDRRANQAGQEVALFYRGAKARAIGRGAAQLVHFDTMDANRPQGELVLFEAIQPAPGNLSAVNLQGNNILQGNCGPLPQAYASCLTTTWATGPAVLNPPLQPGPTRQVDFWPQTASIYNSVNLLPPSGAISGTLPDICFTPAGRTFGRVSASVPFTQVTEILSLTIQRVTAPMGVIPIGLPRQIILPPSGEARLFL